MLKSFPRNAIHQRVAVEPTAVALAGVSLHRGLIAEQSLLHYIVLVCCSIEALASTKVFGSTKVKNKTSIAAMTQYDTHSRGRPSSREFMATPV
jgi:hypothetical protein